MYGHMYANQIIKKIQNYNNLQVVLLEDMPY